MAKGKPTGEAPKSPRNSSRPRKDREKPEQNEDIQEIRDSEGDGGNPEWWRGDPGRRGEVL